MGVLTLVQNNNDPQCSMIETYLYEQLHILCTMRLLDAQKTLTKPSEEDWLILIFLLKNTPSHCRWQYFPYCSVDSQTKEVSRRRKRLLLRWKLFPSPLGNLSICVLQWFRAFLNNYDVVMYPRSGKLAKKVCHCSEDVFEGLYCCCCSLPASLSLSLSLSLSWSLVSHNTLKSIFIAFSSNPRFWRLFFRD
jgi:hypothetical protein